MKRRLCVLGRQGFYREYVPGVGHVDIPIDPVDVGYLEDVAPIGDAVFVCGAQGQVYRLRGQQWEAIHSGIHVPFNGEDVERMLLSIAGFAENDLYVCGFEGEVWHFNGKKWSELDSPSRTIRESPLSSGEGAFAPRTWKVAVICGALSFLSSIKPAGMAARPANPQ